MKTYKGIIFDLDGTLLDTIEDLRDSVNDVMKIYGWKEHDTKACKQMVGNGFRKLITRALPEDKQKNELFIDEAVNQFSKAYQKRYLNKTIPYEGILKLLESLEEKGIKQKWLAEQLGKSYNMVNSYAQNRRQPSLEDLYKIAEILQVEVAVLLVERNTQESQTQN